MDNQTNFNYSVPTESGRNTLVPTQDPLHLGSSDRYNTNPPSNHMSDDRSNRINPTLYPPTAYPSQFNQPDKMVNPHETVINDRAVNRIEPTIISDHSSGNMYPESKYPLPASYNQNEKYQDREDLTSLSRHYLSNDPGSPRSWEEGGLEMTDDMEINETLGRLENILDEYRNSAGNKEILERLDRLERDVLWTLVVTNMMGSPGPKKEQSSYSSRLDGISNYIHNDLLTKTGFREGMSQGLTQTRNSIVEIMKQEFNKLPETQLTPEVIQASSERTIRRIEQDVTLKLESSVKEIGNLIDQKPTPANIDYKQIQQIISQSIKAELKPVLELFKLELNKIESVRINRNLEKLTELTISLQKDVKALSSSSRQIVHDQPSTVSLISPPISHSTSSQIKPPSRTASTSPVVQASKHSLPSSPSPVVQASKHPLPSSTSPVVQASKHSLPSSTSPVVQASKHSLPSSTSPVVQASKHPLPSSTSPVVQASKHPLPSSTSPVVQASKHPLPSSTSPVVQASKHPLPSSTSPVVQASKHPLPSSTSPVVQASKHPLPSSTSPVVQASKHPLPSSTSPVVQASKHPLPSSTSPVVQASKHPPISSPISSPIFYPTVQVVQSNQIKPVIPPKQPTLKNSGYRSIRDRNHDDRHRRDRRKHSNNIESSSKTNLPSSRNSVDLDVTNDILARMANNI